MSVLSGDINAFNASHRHDHEKLLRPTTKQLGVVLEGSLGECKGCSVAKGFGKLIGRPTSKKADKVFGYFFVDIYLWRIFFSSIGEKLYMLLICDDYSCFT